MGLDGAPVSATLLVAAPAAAEGLSYNVALTSLYKYNGIDQDVRAPKNVRPALQGGADYDFGNGLYAGNWNSTGQFGAQGKADLEIDLYGGYRGEFGQGWRYDVGAIRFVYPKDNTWNANEWYVRLGLTDGSHTELVLPADGAAPLAHAGTGHRQWQGAGQVARRKLDRADCACGHALFAQFRRRDFVPRRCG